MNNRDYFNSLAQKWDTITNHPEEKINYVLNKAKLEQGANVLDIGSGTGVTIPHIMSKIGYSGHITALDVSEKMIEISKEKNTYSNLDFQICDFYKFNPQKEFDNIVAYSCYPHFRDKMSFFKKAYSLLKGNGTLIIAHIESKEAINKRHDSINIDLESDKLTAIEYNKQIMENNGFNTLYAEDSSNYYILVGKKIPL